MIKGKDERALAGEYRKAVNAFDAGGVLPSAKDLAVVAADRKLVREVVDSSQVVHIESDRMDRDMFELRYMGERTVRIHFPDEKGVVKAFEVKRGDAVANHTAKITDFFPNQLVEKLLALNDTGASQKEMHDEMKGFYEAHHKSPPSYSRVADRSANDPKFQDDNVFLILVENKEFLRGGGAAIKLVGGALDWYRERKEQLGVRYAIVYTRMAEMDNSGFLPGPRDLPYPDDYFLRRPATIEEAQAYLEKVRSEGWSDWSMGFHARAGAKILFGMPYVGEEDHESRYAGAFGVYVL